VYRVFLGEASKGPGKGVAVPCGQAETPALKKKHIYGTVTNLSHDHGIALCSKVASGSRRDIPGMQRVPRGYRSNLLLESRAA
jgi:hypothetical protein